MARLAKGLLATTAVVLAVAALPASASAVGPPLARWTCAAPGLTCDPCTQHCENPAGSVVAGIPVAFDGRPSADDRGDFGHPEGPIASHQWTFWRIADGVACNRLLLVQQQTSDGTASGAQTQHAFSRAGSFGVILKVTDSQGEVDEKKLCINVTPAPPIARFAVSPHPVAGAPVAFDGRTSSDADGTVASHAWSFGDGGSAAGAQTGHIFAAAGTYAVQLTVTDNEGRTSSVTTSVAVAPPPVISRLSLKPRTPRAKRARAAKLSFNVASAVAVSARLDRLVTGRRSGKRCVRTTPGNRRKKRCARALKVGSKALAGKAGANTTTLGALAGRKRLAAGRYRITLRTSAGARSLTITVKR
jgi:hypothetical protein